MHHAFLVVHHLGICKFADTVLVFSQFLLHTYAT